MRTLYVGGLSAETDTRRLKALFSQYGGVEEARVVERAKGRSRGFGYVTLESDIAAYKAMRELNGTDHGGAKLRVALEKPRPG